MTDEGAAGALTDGGEPGRFLASIAAKIEGFLYRCLNNAEWTMLRMTSGFERVLGHDAAGFIREGRSFADLVHPADLAGVTGAVDYAIARGMNWLVVYRLRDASGNYIRVHESGGAVRDSKTGEILYLDGVILDAQRLT